MCCVGVAKGSTACGGAGTPQGVTEGAASQWTINGSRKSKPPSSFLRKELPTRGPRKCLHLWGGNSGRVRKARGAMTSQSLLSACRGERPRSPTDFISHAERIKHLALSIHQGATHVLHPRLHVGGGLQATRMSYGIWKNTSSKIAPFHAAIPPIRLSLTIAKGDQSFLVLFFKKEQKRSP